MLEKELHDYLEKIDKYLKPMSALERADIIKEIESNMLELQKTQKLSPTQITERLGEPRELAKAYLGDAIVKTKGFSVKKLLMLSSFYSLVGLSGMILLPLTGVTGITFMFAAVISVIAGVVKLAASFMGIDIPAIMFSVGNYTASPTMTFFMAVLTGVLLFAAGWGLWKVTLLYIRAVSKMSVKLHSA